MNQINNAQARLFAAGKVSQNYSKAREIQYNNNAKINGDTYLQELLKERKSIAPKLAFASFKNQDTTAIKKREAEIEVEINHALAAYGLEIADIEISPTCKKCGDTGQGENGDCECFKKYMFEYITSRLAIAGDAIGFEKSKEFAKDYAGLLKFYNYAEEFIARYPNVSKNVFLLQGRVGCGKSHLAKEILARLVSKGASGLSVSAFNMETLFVSHKQNTTSFNPSQTIKDEYNLLMNVDVLIVDDLGAEIIHTEKIKPYYVSLLESRVSSGKLTIFTTNLAETDINARYGERFFSRVKQSTVVMRIEINEDLRGVK